MSQVKIMVTERTKNQQNHMIVSIIPIVFVRAITKTNGCVKMDDMQSSPLPLFSVIDINVLYCMNEFLS
jgi:hypothetical protein